MSSKVITTTHLSKQINTFGVRFDTLEGRFDTLEGRFDSLEGRFDTLEGRFDTLEGRFDSLEGRFDTLGNQVSTLANRLDEFIMFTLEHVATKEDLSTAKEELRSEMNVQKLDIIDRMDDKFVNFKNEFKILYEASDKKFNSLVELLRERKGISKREAIRLLGHSYSGTAR